MVEALADPRGHDRDVAERRQGLQRELHGVARRVRLDQVRRPGVAVLVRAEAQRERAPDGMDTVDLAARLAGPRGERPRGRGLGEAQGLDVALERRELDVDHAFVVTDVVRGRRCHVHVRLDADGLERISQINDARAVGARGQVRGRLAAEADGERPDADIARKGLDLAPVRRVALLDLLRDGDVAGGAVFDERHIAVDRVERHAEPLARGGSSSRTLEGHGHAAVDCRQQLERCFDVRRGRRRGEISRRLAAERQREGIRRTDLEALDLRDGRHLHRVHGDDLNLVLPVVAHVHVQLDLVAGHHVVDARPAEGRRQGRRGRRGDAVVRVELEGRAVHVPPRGRDRELVGARVAEHKVHGVQAALGRARDVHVGHQRIGGRRVVAGDVLDLAAARLGRERHQRVGGPLVEALQEGHAVGVLPPGGAPLGRGAAARVGAHDRRAARDADVEGAVVGHLQGGLHGRGRGVDGDVHRRAPREAQAVRLEAVHGARGPDGHVVDLDRLNRGRRREGVVPVLVVEDDQEVVRCALMLGLAAVVAVHEVGRLVALPQIAERVAGLDG